jgi:hypothetical protein
MTLTENRRERPGIIMSVPMAATPGKQGELTVSPPSGIVPQTPTIQGLAIPAWKSGQARPDLVLPLRRYLAIIVLTPDCVFEASIALDLSPLRKTSAAKGRRFLYARAFSAHPCPGGMGARTNYCRFVLQVTRLWR